MWMPRDRLPSKPCVPRAKIAHLAASATGNTRINNKRALDRPDRPNAGRVKLDNPAAPVAPVRTNTSIFELPGFGTVYDADFACLHPGMWLNDSIITLFAAQYSWQHAHQIHLFDTLLYTCWHAAGPTGDAYLAQSFRNNRASSSPVWLVPLHQDYHWQLLVILHPMICSKSMILVLDSLARTGQPWNNSQVISFAVALLDNLRADNARPVRRVPATRVLVPQQQNSFDCGIFVLLNIRYIVENLDSILQIAPCREIDWQGLYSHQDAFVHRDVLLQALCAYKDQFV